MQRGLSWSLFAAAVTLFLFILLFERRIPGTAERREPKRILPSATVNDIQAIEVTLPGRGSVRVERTNGLWTLTEPRYPARQIAIDSFATNLVELRALDRISARDANLEGAQAFGLEPPRATIDVVGASNTVRLEVGGTAPLTSNVYIRLPHSGEVLLATAKVFEGLPRSTNDWRSPALVQLTGLAFDHVQVRAGQRLFELARNATNNVWQISKPVPARADQDRVLELLHVLRSTETSDFVTDAPGADLERFGLQAPDVEVAFIAGTNRIYTIEFGNSATNRTNAVFARLLGRTNVVLAPRQLADYLKQPYKAFHDPRLVTINAGALDRVVVHARENFTLQRQPQGGWIINDAQKTPVDRDLFTKFANTANSLQILDIVKEVPTDADLKAVGLQPSIASYAFFEKLTNATGITTNIPFTELLFGGAQADKIYVRRSDETPIYMTQLGSMLELPKRAFELRDRKIWRFPTNSVLSIAVGKGSVTNTVNKSANGWANDAIAQAQIEEIVFRLCNLNAQEWVEKGAPRLNTFGFNDGSLVLSLGVSGSNGIRSSTLRFGRQTLRRDAYAAIVFPGETEPTIFEFPGDLFQLMLESLPFPK